MKIYDTQSQKLREFFPLEDNKVKMYVCGPTVYDYPHLGHARCYITWDVVSRYLRFKGYDVTYVRNITDVDDKIINRARENNITPQELANTFYHEFEKAMTALNVESPDIEPKATETIEDMIKIIKTLEEKGYAYESEGDVYFRVSKFKKYGRLSKQSIDDLQSGARVESSEKKENPLDFALWKAVKTEDEISWDSPWGKGRPGWHIECSAMSKKYLGESIDIHAGGQDLIFPHHENEKA
jgi:cysteinyl-tRNA synthetase